MIAAIGVGSTIAYLFRVPVIKFLQHPLSAPLFYSSPAGSFNFVLKISMMIGLMIALPVIVYQLIRFVEPALPSPIRRPLILKVISFSTFLALAGFGFAFFVMVPMSLHFFSTYSSVSIKPLISTDEYLSFVLGLVTTFAALFQIPLVILFINRIKPFPPSRLLRYQRHIVVGAFVLAAILPYTYDPISQFIMAVPVVVLFYLSVGLVWMANRRVVFQAEVVREKAVQEPILVASKPVATSPRIRHQAKAPMTSFWRADSGGLKSAAILKTAVDVVKPGTISGQPLKLDAPEPMPVNRYNLIDLSNQA